ncbi:hypothetical protein Tco_0170185 [Tanacetum coccineum]
MMKRHEPKSLLNCILMISLKVFMSSLVIRKRTPDLQLGIKSYQYRLNLTKQTLTFDGIKAEEPYSIVDEPTFGITYLKKNTEKRFIGHLKYVKWNIRSILINHKYKYANSPLTDDHIMKYELMMKAIKRKHKFRRHMMRTEGYIGVRAIKKGSIFNP